MVAEFAVLFARVLEPFEQTVLMTVADGSSAFAGVVEGGGGLRAAATDSTRVFVLHGGQR